MMPVTLLALKERRTFVYTSVGMAPTDNPSWSAINIHCLLRYFLHLLSDLNTTLFLIHFRSHHRDFNFLVNPSIKWVGKVIQG